MYLTQLLRTQSISVFALCVLCACGVSIFSRSSDKLIGKWKANWFFRDTTAISQKKNLRYDMDGFLHFQKDGQVKLIAYGCPNCIMGKDTIEHELFWKYRSDTLTLQNTSDQVDLIYRLEKELKDTLYFALLDQIQLRLIRQK